MQPVIIEDSISIAANTTVDNVIASNNSLRRYLRAPFACRGKFLAISSLSSGLRVSLDYGSKNVVSDIDLRSGTDMQDPNDVHNDEFFLNEGDMIVLRATNGTAGAGTLRYRIILFPWDGELPPDVRVLGRVQSIAVAAVDIQLLDGLRYERPPVDSILKIFMTASAAGLTRQVNVDTDSIAPPSAIPPLNRMPTDPFDQVLDEIQVPKDKLIELSVSNPTAGGLSVFWKVKLREMERT